MYNNPHTRKGVQFTLKGIVFIFTLYFLDFSIGSILSYYYFKQESGLQYRTTYAIEKTKADVLIFGSSRANHHYSPDIFEKRLNLTYYNVGRDGCFILYDYAILKSVLIRYVPKIIILDFLSDEFVKKQVSYDQLSCLLPYYKDHPEMRSIIELKSPYEKIKLLSSIYPYNSSIFTIAIGNMEFNKKRKSDIKGYVPLTNILNEAIKYKPTTAKLEIDTVEVKMYESFIRDCINAKIKLYVVSSPYFLLSNITEKSINIGQQIAKKYHVPFINFSNDSLFLNNSKYFADEYHLNDDGAKVFSNRLMDIIK